MAEESGAFVGFGVGYGGGNYKIKNATSTTSSTTKKSGGDTFVQVVGGYKAFFTPSLGLRVYANFDYQPEFRDGNGQSGVSLMNYAVNADFLYNFITGETYNFGLFAGLDVGANTLGGDTMDNLETQANASNLKIKKTAVDVGLNLGLRGNFYKHFGVEFAVRVPFLANQVFKESGAEITAKRDYAIGVRAIFGF